MTAKKVIPKMARQRMSEFVRNKLEDSCLYKIQDYDEAHICLSQRPDLVENPRQLYVMCISNKSLTAAAFNVTYRGNRARGLVTAFAVYKDESQFFDRIATDESWRKDKSLKDYNSQQINTIIDLSKLEKAVLAVQERPNIISYYQPVSDRMPESIHFFKMKPVILDYSHIKPGHQSYSFVKGRQESKNYKLTEKLESDDNAPIKIVPSEYSSFVGLLRHRIAKKE